MSNTMVSYTGLGPMVFLVFSSQVPFISIIRGERGTVATTQKAAAISKTFIVSFPRRQGREWRSRWGDWNRLARGLPGVRACPMAHNFLEAPRQPPS
jgi:hypothetical protein